MFCGIIGLTSFLCITPNDGKDKAEIEIISKAFDVCISEILLIPCPPSKVNEQGHCTDSYVRKYSEVYLSSIIGDKKSENSHSISASDIKSYIEPNIITDYNDHNGEFLFKDFMVKVLVFDNPKISADSASIKVAIRSSENFEEYTVHFGRETNNSPWRFQNYELGGFN